MLLCVCHHLEWFVVFRIPADDDLKYGELKQGSNCLDTLGHKEGEGAGTFACHGQGGNQVREPYSNYRL